MMPPGPSKGPLFERNVQPGVNETLKNEGQGTGSRGKEKSGIRESGIGKIFRDAGFRLHRSMSYGPVRQPLPCTGPAFLPEIQTGADFQKAEFVYIRVNERKQRP